MVGEGGSEERRKVGLSVVIFPLHWGVWVVYIVEIEGEFLFCRD